MSDIIATNPAWPTVLRGRLRRTAPACRRFGLLDAMILVAATAIGLALTRLPFVDTEPWRHLRNSANRDLAGIPLLAAWTVTVLALRWRSPRPARPRLLRQPGVVALGAATLILGVKAALMACVWVDPGWLPKLRPVPPYLLLKWWEESIRSLPVQVGPAVAGAWVILWRGGRRRPERGWLDWSGRLIGVAWVALALIIAWGDMNERRGDLSWTISQYKQAARRGVPVQIGPDGVPLDPLSTLPVPMPTAPPPL